ncbi:hypothetical protein E2C01_057053 [Portunus trituberculatus]|uniref:Uncharacterized protein n=1 Tax=Portunus trituberculatus TaxID=210409 RepID=A0A5B7GVS7_PORTR|nr:hypothetical protein [Portunus trituberculatus]
MTKKTITNVCESTRDVQQVPQKKFYFLNPRGGGKGRRAWRRIVCCISSNQTNSAGVAESRESRAVPTGGRGRGYGDKHSVKHFIRSNLQRCNGGSSGGGGGDEGGVGARRRSPSPCLEDSQFLVTAGICPLSNQQRQHKRLSKGASDNKYPNTPVYLRTSPPNMTFLITRLSCVVLVVRAAAGPRGGTTTTGSRNQRASMGQACDTRHWESIEFSLRGSSEAHLCWTRWEYVKAADIMQRRPALLRHCCCCIIFFSERPAGCTQGWESHVQRPPCRESLLLKLYDH